MSKPPKAPRDKGWDILSQMTQPNQSELKCGHTAPDWNGEGDCITCARNKVLDDYVAMTKQNNDGSNSKIQPENRISVDEILESLAFRCAGGITNDGAKEYLPAKAHLRSLVKEMMDSNIGADDDNGAWNPTYQKWRNELRAEQRESRDELLDQYFGKEG